MLPKARRSASRRLGPHAGDVVQGGAHGALFVALVVEGDGEAVGLLLNAADEGKDGGIRGDADLPALRRHQARVRWRSSFTMPNMGTAQPNSRATQHRRLGMGHAAVDQEGVGQRQKFLVPVRGPLPAGGAAPPAWRRSRPGGPPDALDGKRR
jgi:hypothetical protein